MAGVFFHVQHLLGIGHLRRTAALARAVAARGIGTVLASGGMPVPDLDTGAAVRVQLPPCRAADASFRVLLDARGRPLDDRWRAARRAVLLDSAAAAAPDVVVVEMFPFGRRALRFELLPLVEAARRRGAKVVCSVRDILVRKDAPGRLEEMADLAVRWFDAVLVHADPAVVPFEATFPLAARLEGRLYHTGFIASGGGGGSADGHGEVLVSAGGGARGEALYRTALAARRLSRRLGRARWRLLVGHGLGEGVRESLRAAAADGVVVEPARADFPGLLGNCALSVSQAGYNTVTDLLAAGTRAVLVPFAEAGETEQTDRARLVAGRGLAVMVDPGDLSPATLAAAVDAAAARPAPTPGAVALDGIARGAGIIAGMMPGAVNG